MFTRNFALVAAFLVAEPLACPGAYAQDCAIGLGWDVGCKLNDPINGSGTYTFHGATQDLAEGECHDHGGTVTSHRVVTQSLGTPSALHCVQDVAAPPGATGGQHPLNVAGHMAANTGVDAPNKNMRARAVYCEVYDYPSPSWAATANICESQHDGVLEYQWRLDTIDRGRPLVYQLWAQFYLPWPQPAP
jgi:hypothetical protein